MSATDTSGLRRRKASSSHDRVSELRESLSVLGRQQENEEDEHKTEDGLSFIASFTVLLLSRLLSAANNIVHDCDETFNYWEPLHYITYGYGLQTWEYSSEFSLRSYLYLLVHQMVAYPASLLFGAGKEKVFVFYAVRVMLAVFSSASEAALLSAVANCLSDCPEVASVKSDIIRSMSRERLSRSPSTSPAGSPTKSPSPSGSPANSPSPTRGSPRSEDVGVVYPSMSGEGEARVGRGLRVGVYSLLLLCCCSGNFLASTTFLPSTFSMYAISLATALVLREYPLLGVAVAAAGCLLGWPFAALAALPLVLYSMRIAGFWKVIATGTATTAAITAASVAVDRAFYGKWTCSLLNLVLYNVFPSGHGGSDLYGVEGPFFYLRNLFNNFNFALPLALVLPFTLPVAVIMSGSTFLRSPKAKRGWRRGMTLVLAPLYLWLVFMSRQAHKEERFMYVIYPFIPVAAAVTIATLPDFTPACLRKKFDWLMTTYKTLKAIRPVILSIILVLSYCRTTAVLTFYSAPVQILSHLPAPSAAELVPSNTSAPVTVCFGTEWHRFPSSFFLPSPHHRMGFVDEGFTGLLPFPFNDSAGGTAAAPSHFNQFNRASPGQFVASNSSCDYLIKYNPEDRVFPHHKTEPGSSSSSSKDVKGDGLQGNATNSSQEQALKRLPEDPSWEVLATLPFADAARSPSLYRALFIPYVSEHKVWFGSYYLLRRLRGCDQAEECSHITMGENPWKVHPVRA